MGEARWRNRPMPASYLGEIEEYKLPALRQSGLKVDRRPGIVLLSRAGYDERLRSIADQRDDVHLVPVAEVLLSTEP